MSERFFVAPPITGDRALLTGDEARHLAAVMRAQPGDEVLLFDGSGQEFTARVETIKRQAVELAIVERRAVSRELKFSLTLAVALPKGDRQKWLVEKATELGVTRLVPLVTERGVAQPVESALQRLRRSVIEASKQCGRNRLLEIGEPLTATELFAGEAAGKPRLIADPQGQPLRTYLEAVKIAPAASSAVLVAIGPEGGFAPGELSSASAAGWQAISLGERILRVETAAIAIAAYFAAAW
jgi:16S rRNA (uracil1498-N3)-methyltransferase